VGAEGTPTGPAAGPQWHSHGVRPLTDFARYVEKTGAKAGEIQTRRDNFDRLE
jgi:hypothetical protein